MLGKAFLISLLTALSLCAAAAPAGAAIGLDNARVAPKVKHPGPPAAGKKENGRAARGSGLIAPSALCANKPTDAPLGAQVAAMQCMTEYARRNAGVKVLRKALKLDRSAGGKSADILRCNSFSHVACGRDPTYWIQRSGYLAARCWKAGENLAWGVGSKGTVRAIFRAWMRSPGHRANILAGKYRQIGISVRVGELSGQANTSVWTQHFGSHC